MKNNLILICTLLLAIGGCSTTVTATYTSFGSPGYRIACGGFLGDGDLASCYQKAGETCESNGYRVLQTSLSSLIIQCRSADEHNSKTTRSE